MYTYTHTYMKQLPIYLPAIIRPTIDCWFLYPWKSTDYIYHVPTTERIPVMPSHWNKQCLTDRSSQCNTFRRQCDWCLKLVPSCKVVPKIWAKLVHVSYVTCFLLWYMYPYTPYFLEFVNTQTCHHRYTSFFVNIDLVFPSHATIYVVL